MSIKGSPEWFNEKSHTERIDNWNDRIESLRECFLERFSPDKLAQMSGGELLEKVFGNDDSSMVRLLMFDADYRYFGASGEYVYLGIVYQTKDGSWKYNESNHAITISRKEAEQKACEIRDKLLLCVKAIENIGIFETIQDYRTFDINISGIFFSTYTWVIKYYQMLYPQFFPGMYEDNTLNRAISILGLQSFGKSKSRRIINAGEISLFIRRCDVNNIAFNIIYSDEWGWTGTKPPCPSAADNLKNSFNAIKTVNTSFYRIHIEQQKQERIRKAIELDKEINSLHMEGKEKEAIVKVRVNQDIFRSILLKKYKKCCLCGVKDERLLIASHIKPWATSSSEEKLDDNNGLLMCPNHDKLFDKGLISFDADGNILISDNLSDTDKIFMNINENMTIHINDKIIKYLEYHRKNVYSQQ